MAGGDFTPEAYEQLREAYAKEAQDARSVEERGHDIMGLNLGLETAPVDSPWADLIPNAQYPSGKSQYLDEKQDPAAILELMRSSVTKPEEKVEEEEEEISDEDLDKEIDSILQDEDEVEEDEDEDEEESDDDDDEDEEDEDEDEAEEEEGVIDPVDDSDPSAIAAQIAELRAELEQMNFVLESEEEPEVSDDEPE